jgi:hypothetical protein
MKYKFFLQFSYLRIAFVSCTKLNYSLITSVAINFYNGGLDYTLYNIRMYTLYSLQCLQ